MTTFLTRALEDRIKWGKSLCRKYVKLSKYYVLSNKTTGEIRGLAS